MKHTRRPSGDHAGSISLTRPLVRTWGVPPEIFITAILDVSSPGAFQENATREPSGEKTGSSASPLSKSTSTGCLGDNLRRRYTIAPKSDAPAATEPTS